MGKTCHLPGTRNHLVGDAERLERKPRKTPKENPGIIVARSPVLTPYFLDYLLEIDEKINEGVKKGKTDKRFKAFTAESVLWEVVTPAKWDEIYGMHVENNRYTNTTRRSRAQNTRRIRDKMREYQQGLLLDGYWHVNPDTGLCDEPPIREGYAIERDSYPKLDGETLGLQIDLHESVNQDLLKEDSRVITEMLEFAGVKVKVSPEDLNTVFGVVGGAPIPTRRNQAVLLPDTPLRAIEFDEITIL